MSSSLDPARRSLATAARALDEFRRLSGAEAAGDAPPSSWRAPAETGARAALDEARARIAELSAALDQARKTAGAAEDAAAVESRRSAEARDEAMALRARTAALETEAAALREALDAAVARERRAEEHASETAADWTARLELLEREALSSARAESQRELASLKARTASLEADLESARGRAEALETEAEALRAAADSRAAARADSKSNADVAQRRASEAAARVSLLEAECVRLERLRHAADRATADMEAQGRDVAEALRREVRAANVALDRAAVEAGAAEAKSRAEAESLRARLESATARLQTLEREKRLDSARGAGDSAATQTELLRAQAVAASLRQELSGVRAAAERQEDALRRELSAARLALDEARRSFADRLLEAEEARRELQSPLLAGESEGAESERNSFVQPPVDPVLDPGWARLVRLVRPPVDAAYAHLRRLSATALTAGQKTLLRMAAASVVQASDSLSSIELALEEGPAPGAASPVMPIVEESLAAWESAFRARGVAILRDFSSPLPDSANNPKELRIALHHVLRNVLEAVPKGGRLAVRAWRGSDGGLRLEFADDGPGFPAEWLERRFEPFAAPRRGRAGLGLSIVRRTLRRWGGDAEASNGQSGRGARLTLSFAPHAPPTIDRR